MQSAWIKLARGVEHQQVLARAAREFDLGKAFDYERLDNVHAGTDPTGACAVAAQDLAALPGALGILAKDVLTDLRAALDHTFWAAALAHSGMPTKPNAVTFPLATANDRSFKNRAKELRRWLRRSLGAGGSSAAVPLRAALRRAPRVAAMAVQR